MVSAFVPVTFHDSRLLRDGADLGPRRGCAATSGLAASLGPGTLPEEVDYATLNAAGVLALAVGSDALRLVLAVEVEPEQVVEMPGSDGEVTVTDLRWSQVRALFADERAAEARACRRACGGLGSPVAGSS